MRDSILICAESLRKSRNYVEALKTIDVPGERIRVVTPQSPLPDAAAAAAEAAGLILCGGPDVDPRRYGEEPLEEAGLALYPALDALEWEVLEGARRGRTPVWAICRGLQTLNVFLGGTLYQDIGIQVAGAADHNIGQPLDHIAHGLDRISTATPFGALLASDRARVNSRHHQAIKDLAPGLRRVADSPDGVLEVIEGESPDWWLRGVQWHPEDLIALPLQRALWRAFTSIAGGTRRARASRDSRPGSSESAGTSAG